MRSAVDDGGRQLLHQKGLLSQRSFIKGNSMSKLIQSDQGTAIPSMDAYIRIGVPTWSDYHTE